jgi:hypothetical protein
VEWKKEAHGNGNKIIIIENDSLVEKKNMGGDAAHGKARFCGTFGYINNSTF